MYVVDNKKINREFFFRSLWLPNSEKEIDNAIYLIIKELPKILHPIAWDEIKEEFVNLDLSIVSNLENLPASSFISISELCGVTFKTLSICYNFAKTLFGMKEYEKAKSIFTFLVLIYPDYSHFWIGMILSLKKLKDKSLEEYLSIGEKLFPFDVQMTIQSARCYLFNGNKNKAWKKLVEMKQLMIKDPKIKKEFSSHFEYLLSRLN